MLRIVIFTANSPVAILDIGRSENPENVLVLESRRNSIRKGEVKVVEKSIQVFLHAL